MTSRDFCYWLQGYFEVKAAGPKDAPIMLTPEQINTIKAHLAMVFIHEIDPSFPAEQQSKLTEAHIGDPKTKPFDPHTDSTTLGGVGPHGVLYRC